MQKIVKLMTVLPILLLAGCENKYRSSYWTTACVQSSQTSKGSISFAQFKGRFVFKLKRTADGDGAITYEGKINEGEITVFYDTNDIKSDLFTLSGEQSVSDVAGYVTKGVTVYIVIESNGVAKGGKFSFNLN